MKLRGTASALIREPLLQFLLLGVALFAADRFVLENAEDPRRIVVDDEKYAELVADFEQGQGRSPSSADIQQLIIKWSQNEVLYREARRMGLDRGDDMIRQRLILKQRNILFNNIVTQPPPESELRAWFEARRADYDRPARFDVEQFEVPAGDPTRAEALASELGGAAAPPAHAGSVRRYYERPAANLLSLFGDEHGRRLIESADQQWIAVRSEQGWHVARVTRRYPGEPANFADVRSRLAEEYNEAAKRAELAEALKGIVEQYDIRVVLTRPAEELALPKAAAALPLPE